jgi:hypothetical protein
VITLSDPVIVLLRKETENDHIRGCGAELPDHRRLGQRPGELAASVSTQAATFEAWIRTTVKDPQTIILGSPSGLTVATSFDPVSRRSSTWSAAAGPVQAERLREGMWSLTIKAT